MASLRAACVGLLRPHGFLSSSPGLRPSPLSLVALAALIALAAPLGAQRAQAQMQAPMLAEPSEAYIPAIEDTVEIAQWTPGSSTKATSAIAETVYQSYDSARSALTTLMRQATSRIIIVTNKLGDAEIATVVHSMQLRGRQALVVIDQKGKSYYKSRHDYLIKAGVTVYFTNLSKFVSPGRSIVVLDGTAIDFGSSLDPSSTGSVVVRPSRYTPDELVKAINSRGTLERGILSPRRPAAERIGAKPSTSSGPAHSKSGNIGGGVKLRARSPSSESRALPRSLPRKTVLGDILSGARDAEEPVVPVRDVQEEKLKLDNERDLRAD